MSPRIRQAAISALLPLTLLLGGCSVGDLFGTSNQVLPVGVYKSDDRGETWTRKNAVLNPQPPAITSLNDINVATLMFDPTDRTTLYLGSENQGLYATYNGGESWLPSRPIRSQAITSIAVPSQPNLRCTIHIATGNKLFRTTDCGRHWDQTYVDTRANLRMTVVAVSPLNAAVVLAGNSLGDVIRSTDGGTNWQTVARLKESVVAVVPHTLNEKIIYAALNGAGIFKSTDGGVTWGDASEGLKEFKGATAVRAMAIDPSRPETVILATTYGLIQTTDGGTTWRAMTLLTPAGKAKIYSVAMNPKRPEEIYYTTDTTLYHSTDAGKTWETKTLPVTNVVSRLLIDPEKPETLYLGFLRTSK